MRAKWLAALAAVALAACGGDSTGPSDNASLVVVNQTTTHIEYLYVSDCASTDWGSDRLGSSQTIAPGASHELTLKAGCYDVRVEFEDGGWAEGQATLQKGAEFTWRVTEAVDETTPVVAITSPVSGSATAEAAVPVQGTITDNVGITRVTAQLNGGAEEEMQLSNAGSKTVNFTIQANLAVGQNTIVVHGYDDAGNRGSAQVTVTRQVLDGVVYLVAYDLVAGQPVETITVTATSPAGAQPTQVTAEGNGVFRIALPAGDGYTLAIGSSGYFSATYSNVSASATASYLDPLYFIGQSYAGTGSATGTVTSALTGSGVAGATVLVRAGLGVTSGTAVATAVTDAAGAYTITGLAAGYYTAEVSLDGWISGYFSLVAVGGYTVINQNTSITPVLPADQYRVVLTWGEAPADLDLHATGPTADGAGRFRVYFYSPTYAFGGVDYAQLDKDDREQYGPETVTILKQSTGTYRFSVHDYTNRASSTSTGLSASGAQVRVYQGSTLRASFNVPSGQPGTLWTVFELAGDQITRIDEMSFELPENAAVTASIAKAPAAGTLRAPAPRPAYPTISVPARGTLPQR